MLRTFLYAPLCGLLLSVGVGECVYAFAGTDPNIIQNQNIPNFRRAIDPLLRYRFNKRSIEASSNFTNASGSTTFDRRAEYLRQAQLERIQQELEDRKFSGERRSTRAYYERENRSPATARRRLDEAARQGGIRLRRGTSSLQQLRNTTSQEKAERIREYRMQVKAAEAARYNFEQTECGKLLGRRRAQCLYEQQLAN